MARATPRVYCTVLGDVTQVSVMRSHTGGETLHYYVPLTRARLASELREMAVRATNSRFHRGVALEAAVTVLDANGSGRDVTQQALTLGFELLDADNTLADAAWLEAIDQAKADVLAGLSTPHAPADDDEEDPTPFAEDASLPPALPVSSVVDLLRELIDGPVAVPVTVAPSPVVAPAKRIRSRKPVTAPMDPERRERLVNWLSPELQAMLDEFEFVTVSELRGDKWTQPQGLMLRGPADLADVLSLAAERILDGGDDNTMVVADVLRCVRYSAVGIDEVARDVTGAFLEEALRRRARSMAAFAVEGQEPDPAFLAALAVASRDLLGDATAITVAGHKPMALPRDPDVDDEGGGSDHDRRTVEEHTEAGSYRLSETATARLDAFLSSRPPAGRLVLLHDPELEDARANSETRELLNGGREFLRHLGVESGAGDAEVATAVANYLRAAADAYYAVSAVLMNERRAA